MSQPNWVMTIVITDYWAEWHLDANTLWHCVFQSDDVPVFGKAKFIIWTATQDLKEDFAQAAFREFGEAIQQIVRLGNGATVLYSRENDK